MGRYLRSGNTKTCGGNIHKQGRNKKHGLSNHKLYWILAGMKRRCYNKNEKSYKDYGERGIIVCSEWINNPAEFINWGIANGYEQGLEIDRIKVNGNYEPSNCRFVTKSANASNTRKTKTLIYSGNAYSLPDLARLVKIPYGTLWSRIYEDGLSATEAVNKASRSPSKALLRSRQE